MKKRHVIVVGSGNAALCAGMAAIDAGASVTILEKANAGEAGGNSRYTAGAMRFAYRARDELIALLRNPDDEKIADTEFGSYSEKQFADDMISFNEGRALNDLQKTLVSASYDTMRWLSRHNVRFDPIYSRQTFQKDGRYVFWGGLTLEAEGEGVGLVAAELQEFSRLGGEIQYQSECTELVTDGSGVCGVKISLPEQARTIHADAVVLACGGFEASPDLRRRYMGEKWVRAKVRGTRHNTGAGIEMAIAIGADMCGRGDSCHAVPMDLHMPNYGNPELPFIERKHYRKICYFLGLMLNVNGERFVDEGMNFRNYTYAQFGREILNQPQGVAWQLFDDKVYGLLYEEYKVPFASVVEADTLAELTKKLAGVHSGQARATIDSFNEAVDTTHVFDPTILDGRRTNGLAIDKTNWANALDTPPFRAFPVTCGITFTYAGLRVDENTAVLDRNGQRIRGLYACGEMIGDIFSGGYPGGSGLTSGAVFGRIAGQAAAQR